MHSSVRDCTRQLVGQVLRLRIGDSAFDGNYFKGMIDQVRLYRRALSLGKIVTHTDTGTPCVPALLTFQS